MNLRISATQLQAFNLFRHEDFMTEQKLLAQLTKSEPPSQKMELGAAFHAIVEQPAEYFHEDHYISNGYVFEHDLTDYLPTLPEHTIKEFKATRAYTFSTDIATLVGKADAIFGREIWEYKTSDLFDGGSIERLAQSYQWRVYCAVFGAKIVNYVLVELDLRNGIYTVKDCSKIAQYEYARLEHDVETLLYDFVRYIKFRGISQYFEGKNDENFSV